MPSRFQLYMTAINDDPAWIEVVQQRGEGPDQQQYPYLFCIHVAIREADPDGFPKLNELVLLDAYEHTLIAELELNGSSCVGRLTMNGIRQLFFYCESELLRPESIIEVLWDGQPAFATEVTELEHDPEWSYYHELLLPNDEERQQMANRQRVEQLKTSGDLLLTSRKIGHWFAFERTESREQMIRYLETLRFATGVCGLEAEEKGYVLEMIREDRPDLETISDLTALLMEAAGTYEGRYLGWETDAIIG